MNKEHLRSIFYHFLIWTFAFAFWNLLRNFGQEVIRPAEISFLQYVRVNVAMGLFAGIAFGSLSYFIEKNVVKRTTFGQAILFGVFTYLIAIILFISFGMRVISLVVGIELNWETYKQFVFTKQILLFIFYCFLVGFIVDFVKQIDKKFGPGNLWRMLKGEFYHPKEDEKIFMFLDLKDSTRIAEKLGHLLYSEMIQDCFQDLEVVQEYHAEVYQYVGDEAVLTWSKEVGIENSNCLRAYFDFKKRLLDRSAYYEKKYGLIPQFKAGLNCGKIVVAEVGEIKREIAYHGDTINTAARIQGQCNELEKSLLISEFLKNCLASHNGFLIEHVGNLLLKGKVETVNVYSVEVSTSTEE
ncbi:MAG: adenylate/guanylate cyclase domain-containing protein [Chitinophagales bacterium]